MHMYMNKNFVYLSCSFDCTSLSLPVTQRWNTTETLSMHFMELHVNEVNRLSDNYEINSVIRLLPMLLFCIVLFYHQFSTVFKLSNYLSFAESLPNTQPVTESSWKSSDREGYPEKIVTNIFLIESVHLLSIEMQAVQTI